MSFTLIGFPMFVLFVSIMVQAGGLGVTGTPGYSQGFCNPNAVCTNTGQQGLNSITCTSGFTVCLPGTIPTNTIITCVGGDANSNGFDSSPACYITPLCYLSADPAYCYLGSPLFPNVGTYLPAGASIVTGGTVNGQTSIGGEGQNVFTFGGMSAAGFTLLVGIAVGVAVLAGLQIFGSGVSPESIHIIFITGLLLGIWGILTVGEGSFNSGTTSIFTQLNNAGGTSIGPIGTTLFVGLTLIETLGIIKSVSRGS